MSEVTGPPNDITVSLLAGLGLGWAGLGCVTCEAAPPRTPKMAAAGAGVQGGRGTGGGGTKFDLNFPKLPLDGAPPCFP